MEMEREIVELTRKLMLIPSAHNRAGAVDDCAGFIESWLGNNGISYERTDKEKIPTITVLPRPGFAEVLLMSHFDVVPAADEMFMPREENGRLFGRGAIDDKYAVALSLILFREHLKKLESGGKTQKDMCFGLLFTGDEEIGGKNGAARIAGNLETRFFVALDGGEPDLIVTKEKGILHLELTATGLEAHASRPWLGENAFDALIADYHAIRELFTENSPEHWHKTMVLSNCSAGDGAANKVPGKATAVLDIRYTENDDPDSLLADIKRIAKCSVKIMEREPTFDGGKSRYLDLLVKSTGSSLGFEHGASDARYLSTRGIPGVVWGADGESSAHSARECLVISSLEKVYKGLDDFLRKIEETQISRG